MMLADFREPKSIIEILKGHLDTKVIELKYGDYSFGDCVIERKTISDFFSSLVNGRIFEQMQDISRFYTKKCLIIEGTIDFQYVNVKQLFGDIFRINLRYDVNVLFSDDERQTANFLISMHKARNFKRPFSHFRKSKITHASEFFEISPRKLRILFDKFGNLNNILNADEKTIKEISMIGKATIKKIKNTASNNILA